MDTITILRIASTLVCFATFVAIIVWASLRRNAKRFDEAANLPFEQD